MTEYTPENFFDNAGGGSGAPSASLKLVDDFVHGEIVDQFTVEAKKFASDEVELDKKTGKPIMQLVIVLQTALRNWDGVSKVPVIDPADRNSGPKPASEDDGRRAVYVKPFTNVHAAIGKAVIEGTGKRGPVLNGGTLGVKITRLEDTGKGNPLKHHSAVYSAPSASSAFFDESKTQGGSGDASASAPAAQPAAPAPAAEPTPAAPAQQDPWGAPAGGGDKPPF